MKISKSKINICLAKKSMTATEIIKKANISNGTYSAIGNCETR